VLQQLVFVELAESRSFYKRSLYVDACAMLLELYSRAFFRDYFAASLLRMCDDAVPNIRLRLCRLLPRVRRTLRRPRSADSVLHVLLDNTVQRLSANETDRDVVAEWKKVGYNCARLTALFPGLPG